MKSYRMPTYCSPMVLFTLVLLLIASFPGGDAQAAPQYSIDCDGCHLMPPLDSADGSRDPQNGAVKGNHDTHSDATPASCVKCHGPGVLSSNSHMDKTIQLQGDINFFPAGGRYSRSAGVFINQTTVPPLGSCSSVNCHFEAPTPIWGSAKYQSPEVDPDVCGSCHGSGANAAPADGNHPNGQTAAGLKHAAYYGTGAASCVKCHPDHSAVAAPFAHATSATPGGRALELSFGAAPNTGGSYSKPENLAYPDYLPSQTPAGERNGTCSGMYCHSNGAGGGPAAPAVWGGSLDCAGCHGFDANAGANSMATDQHGAHVKNAAQVGWNIGCQECHSSTTTTGNSVSAVAYHVDKNINVKFDNAINRESDAPLYNGSATGAPEGAVKAPQSAAGNCANLYCHSVGNLDAAGNLVQVAGAGFRSIAWNDGAIGCDGCHGNQAGGSHPAYPSGPAASSTANSHLEHVEAKGYGCDYCHLGTTLDAALPPATVKAAGAHLNRVEDVSFMSFGALTGGYESGAKSCSATYCHSSGEAVPAPALASAVWGGSLDCRGCHGGDAGHATPMATGRHTSHMNAAERLGAGNDFACAACHAQTVTSFANDTTLGNALRHVDTYRDYSGVKAGQIGTFAAEQTCGNVYCHSTGEETPTFRNMTGSKRWGGAGTIGCNGCHGYGEGAFTPVAGEPNYPSGPATGNSHQVHTLGANMTGSTGCAICHRTTVDRAVAGRMKDYSSAHVNGVRDVAFAPLANMTGAYLPASKSCSNTYCHGPRETVAWGTPGPLLCNDCHKADATLAGAHASHWEAGSVTTSYTAAAGNLNGSADRYSFECSSCHLGAHSTGPGTGNNAAEVFFGYTAAGLRGSYGYGALTATDGPLQWSNGTCSATYCHSQGDAAKSEGRGSAGMTWASPAKTLRCDGCHGGDASKPESVIGTGLHRSHIDPSVNASLGAGNGLNCVDCHAKTTGFANNTTLSDKRMHVNKFRDYSGAMAGGSASYSQAGKTCSAIYCHSNGKGGSAANQFRDPAPWDQSTGYGCNGCHGQAQGAQLDPDFPSDALLGSPNYLNAGAVGGSSSNSHRVHVQAMGIDSANLCYSCHAGTMDKFAAQRFRPYSTQHLNGVAEVRFGAQSAAGFTLISSVGKANWDAPSRTCSTVACHSNGKGGYQDVQWGAATDCALCHALNKLSRGHAFHVYTGAVNNPTFYANYTANRSNSAAAPGRYNYGCANCHPVINPNHMKGEVLIDLYPGNQNVVGFLRSRNGSQIVNSTGGVTAGTAGSGTTLEGSALYCDNVYCHSNGYSADLRYVKTPDWFAGNFSDSADRCANCHGNSPNSDPADMPGSPSHFNQDWLGTATEGGHFMGIHAKTITNKGTAESQETFIGLLSPGSTEPASHGVAGSSTTVSCNTCHWDTIQTSANFGSIQCSGCHTTPDTRAYASIWDKGTHINGQVKVSFQPGQVKSKAQLRDVSFATVSSATLWHRNGVYKSATGFDSSKLSLSEAGSWSGANCSNVVCHFNKPVPWTVPAGTSVACDSCHSSM